MIIQKLYLENVKSYGQAEITFAPGVNLICGENGAGKSTIIEAIGYALFGVLPPMKKEEFIRTGKRSCTVQVWFSAKGTDYRVERTMRSSGTERWLVYEGEEQMDLHGRADVLPFLQEAMGLGSAVSSQQLFSQMIAVGQNDFLTPFLMAPAGRIALFNGILGVDSYRTASDGLRSAQRELEEGAAQIRLEMAPLSESFIRLQEYRDAQREAEERAASAESAWKGSVRRADILEQLEGLHRQELTLNELIVRERQQEKRLADARISAERLRRSYDEYLALESKQNDLAVQLTVLEERRGALRQELDAQLTRKAANEKTREELNWRIDQLQKELSTAEEREKQSVNAMEAVNGELEQVRASCESLAADVARLSEENGHGASLREGTIRACGEIKRIREGKADLLSLGDLEKKHCALIERRRQETLRNEECRKLEELLVQVSERIGYLESGAKDMAAGKCPIAGVDCPLNCEDLDGMCRIRMEELKAEEDAYRIRLTDLHTGADETLAEDEEAWKKEYHRAAQLETGIERDTAQLESILQGMREHVQGAERDQLEVWLDTLETLSIETISGWAEGICRSREAQLALGVEEQHRQKNKMLRLEDDRARLDRERETAQGDGVRIRKEISALGEEKKELDQALALLYTEEAERTLAACEAEYQEADSTRRRIGAEMSERRLDYAEYLSYDRLLSEGEGIAQRIQRLMEDQKGLKEKTEELKGQMDRPIEEGESARGAREEVQKAAQSLGEAREALAQAMATLTRAEQQAVQYGALEDQLTRKNRALELMGELRDVLKRASGPMAEAIRAQVSAMAGDTYRAISGESGNLTWDSSFDILLSDTEEGARRNRRFHQLSGGEKMTAALSVRLALIRTYSNLSLAFFDEPTSNLDVQRRSRLGEMIPRAVDGFDQLFLISHDDAFYSITENVVFLQKGASGTVVAG